MRIFDHILSCLFLLLCTTTASAQTAVFSNTVGEKPHYRIPALAITHNDELIAFADNRYGTGDIGSGRIDVAIRNSFDCGETWQPEKVIIQGVDSTGYGYGDAAVVCDRETDRILILTASGQYGYTSTKGNLVVARTYLNHNNRTTPSSWEPTEPEDITSQFNAALGISETDYTKGMFFASGRICQSRTIKVGAYYRIYSATLVHGMGNYVFYSDDFGQTWKLLGDTTSPVPNGDEAKIEELPNGNVVISSRKSKGRYFNIFTYTEVESAQGSWAKVADSSLCSDGPALSSNACNGEILIVPALNNAYDYAVPTWIALQSGPTGSQRANVSIYWKELNDSAAYDTPEHFASNWTGHYQVSETQSCYSTMVRLMDGTISFIYEEGLVDNSFYDIKFVNLPLDIITDGKYSNLGDVAIRSVQNDTPALDQKCIYNLQGQPISDNQDKGFYIQNGSKYLRH